MAEKLPFVPQDLPLDPWRLSGLILARTELSLPLSLASLWAWRAGSTKNSAGICFAARSVFTPSLGSISLQAHFITLGCAKWLCLPPGVSINATPIIRLEMKSPPRQLPVGLSFSGWVKIIPQDVIKGPFPVSSGFCLGFIHFISP